MRSVRAGKAGQAGSAVLRRANPDDARAVADVLIRSRRASVGSIPSAVHSDDEIREWINAVVIREREVWLAESDEGRALAMLVLDGSWIDQLYVDPTWTGMGVGLPPRRAGKVASSGGTATVDVRHQHRGETVL